MKEWKKLLPITALLPVLAVTVCIICALKEYIPPVYSVDAAWESTVKEEPAQESVESIEGETESQTSSEETYPSIMPITENAVYKDGTYYGSGMGFAGNITVCVDIKEGKITSITITETKDGDSFIRKASGIISLIIKGQSTNVDVVSGATYSSAGIIEAVRNALKQAVLEGSSPDDLNETLPEITEKNSENTVTEKSTVHKNKVKYKDGTYYGTGKGFAGIIKVKVVIKNGKIIEITIVKTSDGKEYIESAESLLKQIVSKQTVNVDAVSGATYSSNGLIEAVKDALKDAVINEDFSQIASTEENKDTTVESTKSNEEETTVKGRLPYKNGVYFGTGEGYRGEITVAVVIEEKAIRYILITKAEDDDTFLTKAKEVINKVMAKQNTDVDAVSGATYSSEGILEAIENALDEAERITKGTTKETTTAKETKNNNETTKQQETLEGKYKDGTYTAETLCNPDDDWDFEPYTLSVSVTIKNDIITAITDIKGVGKGYDSYNDWYIKRAAEGTTKYPGVVSRIIEKGSTSEVDAVSGATCSSKAIVQAVQMAVEKGKGLQ